MPTIAIDLDGVVQNNLPERYLTARNTVARLLHMPRLSLGEFLASEDEQALERRFESFVPYTEGKEDTFAVVYALHTGDQLESGADLASVRAALAYDMPRLLGRHKEERGNLQREGQRWYQLQPAYKFFIDAMPSISEAYDEILLLSVKHPEFSLDLLRRHDIAQFFDNVHEAQRKDMWLKENCNPRDTVFIDDQYKFVHRVHNEMFTTCMSTWGYSTPLQQHEAAVEGIILVSPATVGKVLPALAEILKTRPYARNE